MREKMTKGRESKGRDNGISAISNRVTAGDNSLYRYLLSVLIIFLVSQGFHSAIMAQSSQVEMEQIEAVPFITNGLFFPTDITLVKNWLFLKEIREDTGEYGLLVYNIQTGEKVYEFIRPGKGPGEFLSFDIRKGPRENQLEIAGSKTLINVIYDVDCLSKEAPSQNASKCIIKTVTNQASREAIVINDSLVFNTGARPNGVLFLSKRNKVVNYLDPIPENLLKKYNRPIPAAMAMGGDIVSNYDRTKFAFFGRNYDKISIYRYNNQDHSLEQVYSNTPTYLPNFNLLDYGNSSALTTKDETRFAYRNPVSSRNHIFVPYSGKTNDDVEVSEDVEWRIFTNRVKVFDWNGNEIKELTLNYDVSIIIVDDEESVLFGVHLNRKGESMIVKATLK